MLILKEFRSSKPPVPESTNPNIHSVKQSKKVCYNVIFTNNQLIMSNF